MAELPPFSTEVHERSDKRVQPSTRAVAGCGREIIAVGEAAVPRSPVSPASATLGTGHMLRTLPSAARRHELHQRVPQQLPRLAERVGRVASELGARQRVERAAAHSFFSDQPQVAQTPYAMQLMWFSRPRTGSHAKQRTRKSCPSALRKFGCRSWDATGDTLSIGRSAPQRVHVSR